jgi:hypothetical protein
MAGLLPKGKGASFHRTPSRNRCHPRTRRKDVNLAERWIRFTNRWLDRLLCRLRRDPEVSLAEYKEMQRLIEDHKGKMKEKT